MSLRHGLRQVWVVLWHPIWSESSEVDGVYMNKADAEKKADYLNNLGTESPWRSGSAEVREQTLWE